MTISSNGARVEPFSSFSSKPSLDQLAHIRVNVFVVSTKLLRELPRVAAIVCGNKPNKLESFFRDGREQLPQAAKRKPRCRRAACFHLRTYR